MRVKGIPKHEKCTDERCKVELGISCLTTDKTYMAGDPSTQEPILYK